MNASSANAVLLAILQRLSRSFLQYSAEAFPWATAREKETLAKLQKLIAEELACAARIGKLLQSRHVGIPPLSPYPMAWTSYNFASLDFFLPLLVEHQRKFVADLEKAVGSLWNDLETRELVQHVLEVARKHLLALQPTSQEPVAA